MVLGPLSQVHVSVSDLDKSVAFYRDVLGIPFLFEVPGQPMAFLSSGGVRLYLGVPTTERFRSRSVLYFDVEDVDAERERLLGRGVDVEQPRLVHREATHELWMAVLEDPDGHQLVLTETRKTS
jgi:predicted enzyme related to lactoylglutathione lyase